MTREDGVLRVAVIGSGLAGLTTAYLLRREGVEVWLIEKSDRLGFHSASVEIPVDGDSAGPSSEAVGKSGARLKGKWVVDVPMRSFQGGYYPLLIALYRHLGLPVVPTFYTYSFSRLLSSGPSSSRLETHFIHSGASGVSLPALPARTSRRARAILDLVGMAAAYLFWLVVAFLSWHDLLAQGRQTSLRDLTSSISSRLSYPLASLSASGASLPARVWTPLGTLFSTFISDIVIPIYSAVGTMTTTDVLDTPVGCLLDYAHSTVGTPHYTLAPGYTAASVAERLAAAVREQGPGHLRLGETVLDMVYTAGTVRIECRTGAIEVDQVVVATQASAAFTLCGMLEASLAKAGQKAEKSRVAGMRLALKGVEYRETIVVTHRDWSVLPAKADQREINLTTPVTSLPVRVAEWDDATPPLSASSSPSSAYPSMPATPVPSVPYFAPSPDRVYTMGTHIIQPPAHLKGVEAILQTTNPVCPIDPDTVLSVSRLERALPLRDPAIYARLYPHQANATPLIHLAGSYAHPGIPLLEGCVASAIRAATAITGKDRLGDVDWAAGQGGRLGRLWRYRRGGVF